MTEKTEKPALFETLRITTGVPENIEFHCDRMMNSAKVLGHALTRKGFGHMVDVGLAKLPEGVDARMRITLFDIPHPSMSVRAEVLSDIPGEVALELSTEKVHSDNPLLRHKTTARKPYDAAQAAAEERGLWDGILQNEREEITETGRANIIALVDGALITPPVGCGLLPGIIRGILLESGDVREAALIPEDLTRSRALFVTNSLVRVAAVRSVRNLGYDPDEKSMRDVQKRLDEILMGHESKGKLIRFPGR